MAKNNGQLSIEHARIWGRNFSGEPSTFNRSGERNFLLTIDDEEVAFRLKEEGWNVKRTKPHPDDPDYEQTYYIPVKVKFDSARPPRIIVKKGSKLQVFDEDNVGTLDSVMIKDCAVVVNPYTWRRDDGSIGGISAYLQSMLMTVEEDLVDQLLADMESPSED